jgi:phage terminase large subunit
MEAVEDPAAPTRQREVLIEGPRGTGKTRAILEYVNVLCRAYPGIRVLWCRKTLKSLRESVQVIWEDIVLAGDRICIVGHGRRHSRAYYTYPNGSHIVLEGLEDSSRLKSSEWDIICIFEATEVSVTDWFELLPALRGERGAPYQQAIADCNPASKYHWLNKRAATDAMLRLKSKHKDNPSVTEAYLDNLRSYTGTMRRRYYLGEWVSEEGLVWETYDEHTHRIKRRYFEEHVAEEIKWHFASMDWGFRHAGVLQVWGVTKGATRDEDCIYRVAEWYATQKDLDWWAARACEADEEYGLSAIPCDPSRPDAIKLFNQRLADRRGADSSACARKAKNQKHAGRDMGGLDLVRWGFREDRIFFVEGSSRYVDKALEEAGDPVATEEELLAYTWLKADDGKEVKEEPDPVVAQDGCDAVRYAAMFAWRREMEELEPPWEPKPLSYADWADVGVYDAEDEGDGRWAGVPE